MSCNICYILTSLLLTHSSWHQVRQHQTLALRSAPALNINLCQYINSPACTWQQPDTLIFAICVYLLLTSFSCFCVQHLHLSNDPWLVTWCMVPMVPLSSAHMWQPANWTYLSQEPTRSRDLLVISIISTVQKPTWCQIWNFKTNSDCWPTQVSQLKYYIHHTPPQGPAWRLIISCLENYSAWISYSKLYKDNFAIWQNNSALTL